MKKYFGLFKKTFQQWIQNKAFEQSAAIAYYTLFSLPSLLVIVISIAGYFFGKSNVQSRIIEQLGGFIGVETAIFIERIITNVSLQNSSSLTLIISFGTLVFGATGAFFRLKKAMNRIWSVREKKSSFISMIISRVISLGMVIVLGFMLIISLVIHTLVNTLGDYISQYAPNLSSISLQVMNFLLSYLFIIFLFSAIFKWLPDIKIRWKPTLIGASFTTILFMVAVYGLGYYFGKTNLASIFGGASSVILVMLWVYYSCLILFLGAEFTVQYALFKNEKIEIGRFGEPAFIQQLAELKEEKIHLEERKRMFKDLD